MRVAQHQRIVPSPPLPSPLLRSANMRVSPRQAKIMTTVVCLSVQYPFTHSLNAQGLSATSISASEGFNSEEAVRRATDSLKRQDYFLAARSCMGSLEQDVRNPAAIQVLLSRFGKRGGGALTGVTCIKIGTAVLLARLRAVLVDVTRNILTRTLLPLMDALAGVQ